MSAVSRLRRRQPLRGGDRHIRSGISCCGFSAPRAIRRAVACGHGNASATRVGGGRFAIPPFAPRGPGRWSDAGHRSVLTPIGRPSRDRAAAAAVAGHGNFRPHDRSQRQLEAWNTGWARPFIWTAVPRTPPCPPAGPRGPGCSGRWGPCAQVAILWAGNARVPIRDRRMTF